MPRADHSAALDPDRVPELFLQFWVARGLLAAIEMDLFEHLEGEGLTLDEVRSVMGLRERPARALLDLGRALGLVALDGARYRNTADASRYLVSGSEYSVRNWARDERWCWDAWGRLEEALRQDAQTLPPDEDGYHAFPADFFLDFLHGHTLSMAERLAEAVDLSGVGSILDVGGGSGATSIALCRAFPALRSTLIDQEPVVERAREHIARAGLSERIEARALNFFASPLPRDHDAAVIANLLHDFSPEKARAILWSVRAALPPGGLVLVMEMAPNDERTGPPIPVAFALTMIVNTEGGDAYTLAQYRDWLDGCGFDVEREIDLGGRIVTRALVARAR